jgi:hypothetical protein
VKTALQIFSYIAIVLGALALMGSGGDYNALLGGGLFLTQGVLAIGYINQQEGK